MTRAWGETHTLCGLDLNPSAGSLRRQPALTDRPTCATCRAALAAAAPAPEPEARCSRCGMGEAGHDMFMPHGFEVI